MQYWIPLHRLQKIGSEVGGIATITAEKSIAFNMT
jgi:hypothetical protein